MVEPGGQDVGMPVAFPNTEISGWDIEKVCFSYDPTNTTLYIGIQTFEDASGNPIIFGDADGDGDPAGASLTLQSKLGSDHPHLEEEEYFTMVIDFNQDGTPDLVVGTHIENSLNQFAAVGGKGAPDNNLAVAPMPRFYGAAIAGVSATLSHLPSNSKPHLEFSVSGMTVVPNFAALDLNDPDSSFDFYITTGSLDDDGIAEEFFPSGLVTKEMKGGMMKDGDGDGINDGLDTDNDNDTIPDLVEKDLSEFDLNGDGELSAAETAASGQDTDGDGDIDENDGGVWTDTDGDGTSDYRDTDSDQDGLPDLIEAGNPIPQDSDGDGDDDYRDPDSDNDGLADAAEDKNFDGDVDASESDPTKADTDGDGLCDGLLTIGSCTGAESTKGTDPNKIDTDADGLCDGSIVISPCYDSEGNHNTNPLNADTDGDGLNDGLEILAGRNPNLADPSTPNIEPGILPSSAAPTLGGDVDLNQGPVRLQGGGCSLNPAAMGSGLSFWIFLLFLFGAWVPRLWAVDIDRYRNSMDGLGYFNVESIKTLPQKEFALGLSQHFSHNPLDFGSTNNNSLDSIIGYYYVWNVWGAIGLRENLDLGVQFPISLVTQIEYLESAVEENTSSVGDVRLQLKWRPFENVPFVDGVAILGFFDVPSGNSDDFFGESRLAGGVKAITQKTFGKQEVGLHLGTFVRRPEDVISSNRVLLSVGSEMTYGVGWRWAFSPQLWALASHLWGSTDFSGEITSPIELDFGVLKQFKDFPIEASLGLGFGLNKGYGNPTYRLIAALNFVSNRPSKTSLMRSQEIESLKAKLVEKEIVILQPIQFEVGKTTLLENSYDVLREVVQLLQENQKIQKLRVDGHTDSDGSEHANLELSWKRARVVRKFLIDHGIDPKRLIFLGWGEGHPILPNDSPAAKAKNRRVEFRVVEGER